MAKISLADDMAFAFQGRGIQVTCNHPDVPGDETNLAHQAAVLFFARCEKLSHPIPGEGVCIHIKKKIPVGGGLGGGSSNAATVLQVLNDRYGRPFSQGQLMQMGRCLGADVPFFICNGPALATGVGETLTPISHLKCCHVVLCDSGIHVPTARVFKGHEFCLTSHKKYTIKSVSDALLQGQAGDIGSYLHNDLEASAFRLYPEIRSVKKEMERLLQRPVAMSGSGGSLFVLYPGTNEAQQGYELLCRRWPGKNLQVFLTALQNR